METIVKTTVRRIAILLARYSLVLALMLAPAWTPVYAHDLHDDIRALVMEFDAVQFEMTAGEDKVRALEVVLSHAAELQKRFPNRAEPLCWEGWTLIAQSEAMQGFGILDKREEAIAKLKAAVAIDQGVYNGAPYISLGNLHFLQSLFPFPLRHGGKDEARVFFRKALKMNPNGLEANSHYANFLIADGDFASALQHATLAANSPPLVDRGKADQSLRWQAHRLIEESREKMR